MLPFPSRLRRWFIGAALLLAALDAGAEGEARADSTEPTEAPMPTKSESKPKLSSEEWSKQRTETFEEVWKTVNEAYFDPTFGGVDWTAVGEKFRAKLPEVEDKRELRVLLQEMLAELRRTHFAILPREMSVFTPQERTRIGTAGVMVAFAENEVVVSAVDPNSPGQVAGLRPGEVVLAVDQVELTPLLPRLEQSGVTPARSGAYLTDLVNDRLRGSVGRKASLVVRDAQGAERTVELTFGAHSGEWSEPAGDFPSVPIKVQAEVAPDGIAYLRFNVFTRKVMKGIRALLKAIPADGGLVLDLRGNPGGLSVMASGISGWLSDREFQLGTMHLRRGHLGFTVTPQAGAFLGPVAVLIDSSSASTSEIMAAGLQEAKRARVFGEPSAGAALPSLFRALPTGDLLQYAVADMQTPAGVTLEGQGVTPDEIIHPTAADLAAKRDPVREAAEAWLNAQRQARTADADGQVGSEGLNRQGGSN